MDWNFKLYHMSAIYGEISEISGTVKSSNPLIVRLTKILPSDEQNDEQVQSNCWVGSKVRAK